MDILASVLTIPAGKEATMLILARRPGETIIIKTGDGERIQVTSLCGKKATKRAKYPPADTGCLDSIYMPIAPKKLPVFSNGS